MMYKCLMIELCVVSELCVFEDHILCSQYVFGVLVRPVCPLYSLCSVCTVSSVCLLSCSFGVSIVFSVRVLCVKFSHSLNLCNYMDTQ